MASTNEEQKAHEDEGKNFEAIQDENRVLRAKLLEMESHLTNLSLSPESSPQGRNLKSRQSSVG